MHAPRLFVAISLASVLAACSKPQPHADAALARDLDLALSTGPRSVVSQVELGAQPIAKLHAPAEPSRARAVAPIAHSPRPAVKQTAPVPEPAEVKPQATEETVAVAPAPEPVVVTQAPAPEPQPSAEPQPTQTGRGGSYPNPGPTGGVFRIPGIGGVIIIRGGGGGLDPCDERHGHGHGGMGGGGVLMNPRAPTFPGRMGGGWGRFSRR
jgi:hypothetical protein